MLLLKLRRRVVSLRHLLRPEGCEAPLCGVEAAGDAGVVCDGSGLECRQWLHGADVRAKQLPLLLSHPLQSHV
jgi:hypothetical protein